MRKTETHHLDLYHAEYDKGTGDIILTGVKANSRNYDPPLIKFHIKASSGMVVHMMDVIAQKPAHMLEKAQTVISQIKNAVTKRL